MRIFLAGLFTLLSAGAVLAADEAIVPAVMDASAARELRQAAMSLIEGPEACRETSCRREGYRKLAAAARAGDRFALVALERRRLAAAPGAPGLETVVEIERALAEQGDAVAAWRLVRRREAGDIGESEAGETIRWLTVTAEDESGYPKAKDAAFRLCELYGRGEGVSVNEEAAAGWCERAAEGGHAGAAIMAARLRRGNG